MIQAITNYVELWAREYNRHQRARADSIMNAFDSKSEIGSLGLIVVSTIVVGALVAILFAMRKKKLTK